MIKTRIQKFIRKINIFFYKKQLPDQIIIYFHETDQLEVNTIKDIILFFNNINYEFVSVSTISENFNTQNKMFSFTFDDGFKNWENLIPVFELYDIRATFFLNSVFLTNENKDIFMKNISLESESKIIDKKIISKLVKHNHEIGAHTHSHYKLSNLNFEEFQVEIEKNLEILSEFTNQIKSFAIPYGMRRYSNKKQIDYLLKKFDTVCYGEAGMLFNQNSKIIQRYPWQIKSTFYENLNNLSTNTYFFNKVTKRSGLG